MSVQPALAMWGSFWVKQQAFTLSKGILPIIALNSHFLFIFGTIDFQKTRNYQWTGKFKITVISSLSNLKYICLKHSHGML